MHRREGNSIQPPTGGKSKEPVTAHLLRWTARQADMYVICAISIPVHVPTHIWHLYKWMVSLSVYVLTYKWIYTSAHAQTRCSMNIFNLVICGHICGSCCHLYTQVHTIHFVCMICVWSVGNTFQRMLFVVKPLSSYLPVSLTPSLFPICTNLEIQTYLTLSITKQLIGAFLKIHNICSLFFSLVWRGRGCSSTGFFLRHASHGWL